MWLLAFALSAFAGSYGAATVDHPGFRASIDASVGSWSDPVEEIRAFEDGMEAARRRLAEHEALLKAAFARYATGDHRYARLRGHLVPLAEGAPTVWTAIATGDLWMGIESIRVDLPVAASLSERHRDKMAADFALAQIGATLPPTPDRAADPKAASRLQGILGAQAIIGVQGAGMHALLLFARLQEPEVRAVAASKAPLPPDPGQQEYALPGWALARMLVALFDGRSPHAALPDLAPLHVSERATLIQFAGLTLPDAEIDAGTTALTKLAGGSYTRGGDLLTDWLAALR